MKFCENRKFRKKFFSIWIYEVIVEDVMEDQIYVLPENGLESLATFMENYNIGIQEMSMRKKIMDFFILS